jgi:hypothetical protein
MRPVSPSSSGFVAFEVDFRVLFSSGSVVPNDRNCDSCDWAWAAHSRQTGRLRHDEACRRLRRSIESKGLGGSEWNDYIYMQRQPRWVAASQKICRRWNVYFADGALRHRHPRNNHQHHHHHHAERLWTRPATPDPLLAAGAILEVFRLVLCI